MLSYETLPGDIDRIIADDHAVGNRIFEHLQAGRGDRRLLVNQLSFFRSLHTFAEEEVLFPAMLEAGMAEQVKEGHDRHQQAKERLVLLDRAQPGSKPFEQALIELIGDLRRHIAEEEREYLPDLRRAVGADEMARLGERFLAAKRSAPRRSHPTASSPQVGRRLAHAGMALMDKIRDRVSGRSTTLTTDASGLLDAQAQRLLDTFARKQTLPYELLTPEQARAQPTLADAVSQILRTRKTAVPTRVGAVEDVTVPGPGGDLTVRVYKPVEAGVSPRPGVVWVHGGGWVLYTTDTSDVCCRALVDLTGAIVVSPEYRKAPEHVFPAAHDDVLATYRWVRANASQLGVDSSRMAIGGEGVGGTMAIATCLQLKEAGEPLPVAQELTYPLTSTGQFGRSIVDAAEARPLNVPMLSWQLMHAFRGVPDRLTDPRVDLLSLSVDQLRGLPPTLIITVDRDVVQSQGDEFVKRLIAAGVPVTAIRYGGVMHDFFLASPVVDKAADGKREMAHHLLRAFDPAVQLTPETANGQKVIGT